MSTVPHAHWITEPPAAGAAESEPLQVDIRRRFVRVLEERSDGLVFFEFSIGWPELAVELLLPRPAFAEFCAANQVTRLDGPTMPHHPEETEG
jgi:phenol/toluene 2-monooxygenase (NADH) P0/A0